MATLEAIEARIAKLKAQADALISKKSSAVISEIRALMDRHGLTTADIESQSGGEKRGRKLGSRNAKQTPAKPVAKSKGKPSPNYRDPKTGATWSGNGRPPSWIANAKDRSKFLISVMSDEVATSNPAALAKPAKAAKTGYVKRAAAKKVTTKKVAAKKDATK